MEIVLAIIAIGTVAALIYVNREAKNLDINKDGKVDLDDAKAAVDNTVNAVKEAADVNKDGKIDAEDAKVLVAKAKKAVKKAAVKTKTAAKKSNN